MRPFSFRGDRFPADEFCYAVWMLRVQPQFPGRRDAAGTAEAGQPGPVPRPASAEDSGQLIAHWPGQNSTDRQQAGLASFRGRLAVDRGGAVSPVPTRLRPVPAGRSDPFESLVSSEPMSRPGCLPSGGRNDCSPPATPQERLPRAGYVRHRQRSQSHIRDGCPA